MTQALRIEYTKTEDGVSIAWTSLGEGPILVLTSNVFGDINLYSHQGVGEFVAKRFEEPVREYEVSWRHG